MPNLSAYSKHQLFLEDILYLQRALQKCVDAEDALAEVFYKELFGAHPQTRALFSDDMKHHRNMFRTMIEAAAAEMQNPTALEPLLVQVGKHHRSVGVELDDLEVGRKPFLEAVKSCIGDREFSRHEESWGKLYSLLIGTMHSGILDK